MNYLYFYVAMMSVVCVSSLLSYRQHKNRLQLVAAICGAVGIIIALGQILKLY